MRLTDDQAQAIKQLACHIAGEQARVRVFGSRLDDSARGGDLDLMLELPEPADQEYRHLVSTDQRLFSADPVYRKTQHSQNQPGR
jgi:predicted nucleotidyltransferase